MAVPNILSWAFPRPITDREKFFLAHAEAARTNCKCASRSIGAILNDGKRVLLTAYNGPLYGFEHKHSEKSTRFIAGITYNKYNKFWNEYAEQYGLDAIDKVCPRRILNFTSGQGTEICPCEHAERNLIYSAARVGIATNNYSVALTCGLPCHDCLRALIQAGISQVLLAGSIEAEPYDRQSQIVALKSHIKLLIFDDEHVWSLDRGASNRQLIEYLNNQESK